MNDARGFEMAESDAAVMIYATYPDLEAAREAGRGLVSARLAACVNIIPGMVAIYRWEGRIEEAEEAVMIVKSQPSLTESILDLIREGHPYDTPAIVVLPVIGGSATYLDWINAQTSAHPGS